MADPLVLKFDVETNRAKQGMADLAGSIADNMARVATSMTGGATKVTTMGGALEGLLNSVRRTSLAIGTDILKVANDTGAAATKSNANLQDVAAAFTKAAITSNTAATAVSTGWATGTTALSTTLQQVPALGTAVELFLAYKVAIIGVVGAFALFEKAASTAAEQVKKLQDIAKGSEAAGVGSTFFQVMTQQLEKLNLTAEQASGSLAKARSSLVDPVDEKGQFVENPLMKQLDELRSGKGIASRAYNLFQSAQFDDVETKIKAVILAIKEMNDEFNKTGDIQLKQLGNQFAEKGLGLDPVKAKEFADKIREGKVNVEELIASAQQGGTIFDTGLVARSKELDEKIAEVHRKMDADLKPIMSDLAKLALDFKEAWSATLGPIERVIDAIGRGYGQLKLIHDLDPNRQGIIGGLTAGDDQGTGLADQSRRTETPGFLGVTGISTRAGALGAPSFTVPQGEVGPGDNRQPGSVPLPPRRLPPSEFEKPTPTVPKAATESADEVDTYIKSLQKAVEVLKAENETFGKSNTVKAEAIDLERALAAARTRGTPLTDEEREAVKKLADEEGRAKDKAEELRKAQEAANEQAQFLGNQLLNAFDKIGQSGTRATDVIKDMVKALIKAVEQALLLGSGPLANLFGTQGKSGETGGLAGFLVGGASKLFGGSSSSYGAADYTAAAAVAAPGAYGPGFAAGGMVGRDGEPTFIPYMELAQIPRFATGGGIHAIVHPGEIILNQAQQKNVAAGLGDKGGGMMPPINVTHSPTINGTGLSRDEVFGLMQRSQKEFARNIGPIFSDWNRRYARTV